MVQPQGRPQQQRLRHRGEESARLRQRAGLKFKSNVDRDTKTLLYRDPHILGSQWRLDTQYASSSDGNAREFRLERPFYALDTRWSAGVSLRNEGRIDSVYDNGRIVDQFRTHERVYTAYGGWSAGLRDGWATRWTAGLTHDERHAQALATTTGRLPADRKLIYPWLGVELVEDSFRETRNLDQIGRTEDLALGWHAKLQLGVATTGFGSARNATVFDASVSKGLRPDDGHTLLFTGAASGRIEGGTPADALFGATARYYWRQSARRTVFMGFSADRGSHLDIDKLLTLGGDNGLRGYPLRYRTGRGAGSLPPNSGHIPTGIRSASSTSAAPCSSTWAARGEQAGSRRRSRWRRDRLAC